MFAFKFVFLCLATRKWSSQRGILQSLAENNFSSGSWLKQHFHFAKFFTIISRILEVWRWTCSSTRSLRTPLGWNKIMFTSKFKVDCCLDSAWLGPVHGWKNQKHWNSPTIGTLCHHLHPRQWTHEHLPRKRATARHLPRFLCFDIPLSFIYIPLSFISSSFHSVKYETGPPAILKQPRTISVISSASIVPPPSFRTNNWL